MSIRLGRKDLGNFQIAEKQEWLVTNGIGGYGSGTVGCSLSRGYHGLLVAALKPPTDRRLMFVKIDETLTYFQQSFELASNRWQGGSVSPTGYTNIESFTLVGSVPTWRFTLNDAVIEKRIWMEHGANTVYVSYTVVYAKEAIEFSGRAVVDNRVFHNTGQVAWPINVNQEAENTVKVVANADDAQPLLLSMESAQATVFNELYSNFKLPAESERGLNDTDSHVHAATFRTMLQPGETRVFMASTDTNARVDSQALVRRQAYDKELIEQWDKRRINNAPTPSDWIKQFVLAADQFVVDRQIENQSNGKSIIAGYPWFEDWGRDTMISLPGLTLTTGRSDIAKTILETFARYVDQGMLPNRFPDGTSQPEYNTIDATFWYFQAIRSYLEANDDEQLLKKLFPVLKRIISAHIEGTRYNIRVDPNDGLLSGGQDGVQLTWMDAKVGNLVVTPRIGKPVEVNTLWYNALCTMVVIAKRIGKPANLYQSMADKAKASFSRFWNADKNYCFDVLDGPNGHDAALRPNQIFAVSLPESPLSAEQQRAVVDVCAQNLLSSHGLRSLAPSDPAYRGIYTGGQFDRDSSYHQGTVWGWLIGPFISAHLRVYNDTGRAQQMLLSMADHQQAAGLGTINEIFDGDAPFTPKGTIAQAWSVAEVLRVYEQIEHLTVPPTNYISTTKLRVTKTKKTNACIDEETIV